VSRLDGKPVNSLPGHKERFRSRCNPMLPSAQKPARKLSGLFLGPTISSASTKWSACENTPRAVKRESTKYGFLVTSRQPCPNARKKVSVCDVLDPGSRHHRSFHI
jgi:hypothetical protein